MRRLFVVVLGLVLTLALCVSAETVTIRLAGYSGDTPLMQDVLTRFVEGMARPL